LRGPEALIETCSVAQEPVVYREEVLTIMGVLGDIRAELTAIRGLLGDENGEAETEDDRG
jgi:hypothetical protein